MAEKKVAAKKVVAPKALKTVVPSVRSKVPAFQLVSFEMAAVIPTMSYGNLQPKITVIAPTMEEARDAVMPIIEGLYRTYGEKALTSKVTVTEKIVEAPKTMADIAPNAPEVAPAAPVEPVAVVTPSVAPTAPTETPEAVRKAEKAIALSASESALEIIQAQIEKSTKIGEEHKPALLVLCKEKMASFAF